MSATCPPCVVGFGRASSPCPRLVRLVSCPPRVCHLSALCCSPNSLLWLWGSLLEENTPWPRPGACPPCVRHCPPLCPPWFRFQIWLPRLQLCRPCVRLVSAMCLPCCPALYNLNLPSPPCVFHVSAMCPLKRSHHSPSLTAMRPPCVCHVSSMCRSCVRSLSAMCPLFVSASPPLTGLCPLLACCGAGSWRHQVKFFLAIAQPTAYILRFVVSLLGIHFASPNSAFASAPYAWKTVWGLCWYNF